PLLHPALNLFSVGNIINVSDTTDRYVRQNSFYSCFQLRRRDLIYRINHGVLLHSDEDFHRALNCCDARFSKCLSSSHTNMRFFARFLISSRLSILEFLSRYTTSLTM
ncbi:hypothetical protein PMAYCL1PPCAC_20446, partial [Pristionchus mayeri]